MLRIGTCSWKYDAWRSLIYPVSGSFNYLTEYSRSFNTVEIDQWFWSLFPDGKIVLPDKKVTTEYNKSVPKDFLFTIKVPNSITLTHYYQKSKTDPLTANPYFLSNELFKKFIESISTILGKTACLIFQFEYLNKQKIKSLAEFQNRLKLFVENRKIETPAIAIETRNPNFLTENYFKFLADYNLRHVFLEGYYMPPVFEIYEKFREMIKYFTVIRLHGADRKGIEKIANDNWNKIYINRDDTINKLVQLLNELQHKEVDIYLNVNNHFEGSAPLTIKKIKEKIQSL